MNIRLLVSVIWFLIALTLAVSSFLDENTVQTLLWASVTAVSIVYLTVNYRNPGSAQV
jgi:hypothetical protein